MEMGRVADNASLRPRGRYAAFLLVCGDAIALIGALALSLQLRFDGMPFSAIYDTYIKSHLISLPLALGAYIATFASLRLYRYAWRFASLETVWSVVYGNSFGLLLLILTEYIMDVDILPRSVLVIFWMVSVTLVGGVRILLRLANLSHNYAGTALRILKRNLSPKRVVIMGGGGPGVRVLNALRDESNTSYEVIGFLDDNPELYGTYIRDTQVLGPLDDIYKLIEDKMVDGVFVAMPNAHGPYIREYVMACKQNRIPVKIIPALSDVLSNHSSPRFEDISVEDLLRRPPVRIDLAGIGGYLTGKRVLVTGAGGSIGSEICRQVMALNPASIVLLGHGENSIHNIWQELRVKYPAQVDCLHTVIASVSDDARIDQVFETHRPEVVFHAAAHKHVPLMEVNIIEAVQNNVFGTANVAEACGRYGVERMVLISTDKAVYPSSIMGSTKWLCEEAVRATARVYSETTYVTVRFGNVLGSRGSVVPIFYEQIRRGGPVTVTHPEMTRYFMLIPEAVQLVLEAGAIGKSGELFLLDMGEPVKIADLARDMIRLCGHEPDADIEIKYTGMRAGEKLHEKLVSEDAVMEPAACEGMSVVHRAKRFDDLDAFAVIRQLKRIVERGDEEAMHDFLDEVVPSDSSAGIYKPKQVIDVLKQSA